MSTRVILVDSHDNEIGTEEKLKAHTTGQLHRAFSIFIFNSKGEMLLQKRATSKYHSGGLWSNTCCSHPQPGEPVETAAHRRLMEELGFDCPLEKKFSFIYKVHIEKDQLFEHEFDHVFFGTFDGAPNPNPEEIEDTAWVSVQDLYADIAANKQNYTYWFLVAMDRLAQCFQRES